MESIGKLKIGDLSPRIPIIQGGMGIGISLASLASAVANEGGIGVISTAAIGMHEPDFSRNYLEANIRALKNEIRKARAATNGIIGVNIMVASTNFSDMATTAIEEEVDIIFCGAGLPLDLPHFLAGSTKTKLVPIISSARAASVITRRWLEKYKYSPDAIVVEGPMAGGHLGFKENQICDAEYSLEKLVPAVIRDIQPLAEKYGKSIPVIAAGGIYSGEDIYNFLQMGAAGVQMATRFVTTHECDASILFKQAYINSKKEDIVIINSPVGLPGRAISNQFIEDVNQGKNKPKKCLFHCIRTCNYKTSPYCIATCLINAQEGNLQNGFAFAGANAYMADKIISVKELIDSLMEELYLVAAKSKELQGTGQ